MFETDARWLLMLYIQKHRIFGGFCDVLALRQDFSVRFIRRQANYVTHALVREVCFRARSACSSSIPNCIATLLSCFDLNH